MTHDVPTVLCSDPDAVVANKAQTVRDAIIAATRDIHEKLHHHNVLSRLMADDLKLPEYENILNKYAGLYAAAEGLRASRACYDAFHLQADLSALPPAPPQRPNFDLTTDYQVLGMLYALHGARFGAKQMHNKLKKTLPAHGHAFFGLRFDRRIWRGLLGALEMHCNDAQAVAHIIAGAKHTFTMVDIWMNRDLEKAAS